MTAQCGNCIYAFQHQEPGKYSCRRFPPTVFSDGRDEAGDMKVFTTFPVMSDIGWCGEYEEKPNEMH